MTKYRYIKIPTTIKNIFLNSNLFKLSNKLLKTRILIIATTKQKNFVVFIVGLLLYNATK